MQHTCDRFVCGAGGRGAGREGQESIQWHIKCKCNAKRKGLALFKYTNALTVFKYRQNIPNYFGAHKLRQPPICLLSLSIKTVSESLSLSHLRGLVGISEPVLKSVTWSAGQYTSVVSEICALLRLIFQNFRPTTRCFGSHWWRNIGKCSRLSQLSVTCYNITIPTHLLII